jgi:hypothetical protein
MNNRGTWNENHIESWNRIGFFLTLSYSVAFTEDEESNATKSTNMTSVTNNTTNMTMNMTNVTMNMIDVTSAELNAIRKQLTEMNQSFNLQYLGLQKQMQDESRRFTLVSNIMKTKNDTAKNSINNIR